MKQIKLYYRYCKLDKMNQYQVDIIFRSWGARYFFYWIWYAIGKYLKIKENRNFGLYPYCFDFVAKNVLLAEYDTTGRATKIGERIAKKIMNHYLKKGK